MMLLGLWAVSSHVPQISATPPQFSRRPAVTCQRYQPHLAGSPGQSLSMFFPEFGQVTAVSEHLLPLASVQGEAPALPLTSTSAE